MDALRARLLNDWQQRFPLVVQPYGEIGTACGVGADAVMAGYRALRQQGSVARIGGVWGAGAGGAALLCAFAVPPERLEAVAARVSAHPGVNHNYEREHQYNLWFVITGATPAQVQRGVDELERDCGLRALRLPMERVYRINLGFDLQRPHGEDCAARRSGHEGPRRSGMAVSDADLALAALVEEGLPLLDRPYAAWAEALGRSEAEVLATLARWLEQRTLRRFGVVVRHHELGFAANAMCVFDVPDERVDSHADLLARQPGVTLCYRRARAPGWPYNLYCMVHGRERTEVDGWIAQARAAAGLEQLPQAQLFSRRRFKQCGAHYFRDWVGSPRAEEGLVHA